MTNYRFTRLCVVTVLCLLPILSSCSHINMKQMAYEVLRQQDCRQNQLEDFCSRNFAREYLEYERLRQEYIRGQNQHQWRFSRGGATLRVSQN